MVEIDFGLKLECILHLWFWSINKWFWTGPLINKLTVKPKRWVNWAASRSTGWKTWKTKKNETYQYNISNWLRYNFYYRSLPFWDKWRHKDIISLLALSGLDFSDQALINLFFHSPGGGRQIIPLSKISSAWARVMKLGVHIA